MIRYCPRLGLVVGVVTPVPTNFLLAWLVLPGKIMISADLDFLASI